MGLLNKLYLLAAACVLFSAILSADAAQFIQASNPNYLYTGRYAVAQNSIQYDWPGFQIELSFQSQCIYASLDDNENMYNIFIDGKQVGILNSTTTQNKYQLACGLSPAAHVVKLTKLTEALFGISTFNGVYLEGGAEAVHPPPAYPYTQKVEWIGDSITCGYGDEGTSPTCPFTASTENNYLTYEGLISREKHWQYHVEAWSGRGMVRNYGDKNVTSAQPLPYLYQFTLANDHSKYWNFSAFVPDTVFINLGTNDYSTQPQPPKDIFVRGYVDFLNYLSHKYNNPSLHYYLVCGPMIGNPCCQYVQEVVTQMSRVWNRRVKFVNLQGILTYPQDYGCSGHPNLSGHAKMAAATLKQL